MSRHIVQSLFRQLEGKKKKDMGGRRLRAMTLDSSSSSIPWQPAISNTERRERYFLSVKETKGTVRAFESQQLKKGLQLPTGGRYPSQRSALTL